MSESIPPITIIGVDDAASLDRHHALLEQSSLIVATTRLSALLQDITAPIYPITPIEKAFAQIAKILLSGHVCILASGDPLFYGIARKVIEKFGEEQVRIVPALSSLQIACSRFKLSWDDAHLLSLHGRRSQHIPGLLLSHPKTLVFTDMHSSPDTIARELLQYFALIAEQELPRCITLHVAENLGMEDEHISSCSLQETAVRTFSNLNVLCIEIPGLRARAPFGLQACEFAHSRGLITKDEVRAVTLHTLRLPPHGIFWDIGGGSGSISIEAATLQPHLTIYTVEHREEELANIKENIRRFQLFNIIPVAGRAKDALAQLPAPDRIFVGGSDGEMNTIITTAALRLPRDGRIVINGVTEKTRQETPRLLQEAGFSTCLSTLSIRREEAGTSVPLNPITIMTGAFSAGRTQAGTP